MIRHIITILLLCCLLPVNALAAGSYYYTKPDATSLPPGGRILMYDPATATDKNITGAKLKDEVRTAVSDTALSAQPVSAVNPYQRVAEFKDATGKITMYITANGTQVFGTPVALAVIGVYPANGATGVATSTVPALTTNTGIIPTISQLYVQGSPAAPISQIMGITAVVCNSSGGCTPETGWNIPATLVAGTTYTIKFLKNSFEQTNGETTSSCGPMTDVSGVCTSTFTTAP